MKLATLGSGSSGNCTLIGGDDGVFLIDAGLPARTLKGFLDSLGIRPDQIRALLITHEHSDHWRGAPLLARNFEIPVYATAGTYEAIAGQFDAQADLQSLKAGETLLLNGMTIQVHAQIHDAREPVCYTLSQGDLKCGVVTDLGQPGATTIEAINGCDALVFEANYDAQMLRQGRYPSHLKRRISGGQGHLSNDETGRFLKRYLDPKTRAVVLAHLSDKNNTPQHAMQTVGQHLQGHLDRGLILAVADRSKPFGIIDLATLKQLSAVSAEPLRQTG